jgi:hypothetical protein
MGISSTSKTEDALRFGGCGEHPRRARSAVQRELQERWQTGDLDRCAATAGERMQPNRPTHGLWPRSGDRSAASASERGRTPNCLHHRFLAELDEHGQLLVVRNGYHQRGR